MKKLANKVFNKSLFFLKFRPRSEKEVSDNLRKYISKLNLTLAETEKLIKQTINRLKELQFVNDEEFVKYWIDQRQGSRPKGEQVIRLELKQKGIDKTIIDKIISENLTAGSQKEPITKLINKALTKYKHLEFIKKRQKVIEYLLRRGYIYTEISSLVDESVKKQ